MDRSELRERKMIELFRTARRADEAEAPGFRELRGAPGRGRDGWRFGLVMVGLATVTAGLLLALALWSVAERRVRPATPEMRLVKSAYQDVANLGKLEVAASGGVVHATRSRDFRADAQGTSSLDPLTRQSLRLAPEASKVRFVAVGGGRASSGLPEARDDAAGFNTESYGLIEERGFQAVLDHPLSTFSIDVDTASYANVRRFLNHGSLPPANAVRIEELINYFSYDYPAPKTGDPFSVTVEIADCPWAPEHRLARIGLKGRTASRGDSRGSNLVFLIDVSGSMLQPAKLPLLKSALRLLVNQLDGRDTVSMVVYAGSSGLALEPTSGDDKTAILGAIDRLTGGGGTDGGQGIRLAYKVARDNFIPGGINRVILATDGDFNLGVTDTGLLLEMLEKDARAGIYLTGLGFGMGNYKDDRLETLADKGNGNYHYIDGEREAQKVLVEGIDANLITIAKDVKIQVEFNPTRVAAYRLIGYENRRLAKEDFNDDTKDAGEIGAGHTVTALYEIVPAGVEPPTTKVDPLRYQKPLEKSRAADSGELMTVKLRYKEPEEDTSRLLSYPVVDEGFGLAEASDDFRFAATVAAFGMVLRDSEHKGGADFATIAEWVRDAIGPDKGGHRVEFQYLIDKARQTGKN